VNEQYKENWKQKQELDCETKTGSSPRSRAGVLGGSSWHEGQGCRGGADGNGEVLQRARRTTLRAPIHSKKRCGGCIVFFRGQRNKSSGARWSRWGDQELGPTFGNGGGGGGDRMCCGEGEGSRRGGVDATCVRRALAPFIEGERVVGAGPRSPARMPTMAAALWRARE